MSISLDIDRAWKKYTITVNDSRSTEAFIVEERPAVCTSILPRVQFLRLLPRRAEGNKQTNVSHIGTAVGTIAREPVAPLFDLASVESAHADSFVSA